MKRHRLKVPDWTWKWVEERYEDPWHTLSVNLQLAIFDVKRKDRAAKGRAFGGVRVWEDQKRRESRTIEIPHSVWQWAKRRYGLSNPEPKFRKLLLAKVTEEKEWRCPKCHRKRRKDNCDPCLGRLPGVVGACCGHASPGKSAYIMFSDGTAICMVPTSICTNDNKNIDFTREETAVQLKKWNGLVRRVQAD